MKRFIASLVVALGTAVAPAAAATLLPVVTIAGPVIHAGDIFAGAASHATDAVAPSPPPGTRITYGADWLAAVAREHALSWTPGSALDQVTIVRASRTIDSDAIAQQMMSEIAARQPIENAQLALDNPSLSLVVAAEAPPGIAIDGLTIDNRTGHVSAFVSAPEGDPSAMRRQVTAQLVYRVPVPVLTHPVAPGATIDAGDVDTVLARRDRLDPDTVTDTAQLVGKAPRRALAPGAPVRLGDLAAPILVHRDQLVTIVLETDNLHLSSQGKALADGILGALVRVQNTQSKLIVDATVLSEGVVAPSGQTPPTQRVAQQ